MGLNTAMIVRNDFLHEIKKDPAFGEKVYDAICLGAHAPYHGQAFDVLPSSHADYVQVVAVTGNTIRLLGFGGSYHEGDDEILRRLADGMGYRVVKKRGR